MTQPHAPRPPSVLVLAILGIIYSGFYILAAPCGILMTLHPLAPNPALDALTSDPTYLAILFTSNGLSLILNVCLLICSIGSIKLKPWARTGMIAVAGAQIAYAIFSAAVTFAYVLPKMHTAFAGKPGADMIIVSGSVGAVIGIFIVCTLPVCILDFFNRPNVKNAFKGIFPETGTFPVYYPDSNPPQP